MPGDALERLIEFGADVVRAELVVGSGGNLSVRRPGGDTCWITGTGTWLHRLRPNDFAQVRIADGALVDGDGPEPSSETALHLRAYQARPDVNVVVHLHPQSMLLLDALGERIRLATTDHAYYVRSVARVGFHLPGSEELARAVAAAVSGGDNCVVLAHHGCSVLADSVELAHKRVRNLEEAARLTYRALLLGRELPECPPEFLAHIDRQALGAV